jgi:hypothetical protein
VGNSSVGVRECAYLGIPAVNIGSRQEGRDRGLNSLDVTHDRETIRETIQRQISVGRFPQDTMFGTGNAGQHMAQLLAEVPLSIEKRLTFDADRFMPTRVDRNHDELIPSILSPLKKSRKQAA